jgi:hypothetical protein
VSCFNKKGSSSGSLYLDDGGFWKVCRAGRGPTETGWNYSQKADTMTCMHAAHEHPLAPYSGRGWRCDVCSNGTPSGTRFRCTRSCDFDICAECWPAGVAEADALKLLPPMGSWTSSNATSESSVSYDAVTLELIGGDSVAVSTDPWSVVTVGMRLEAKDRQNPELICVATIAEKIDGPDSDHPGQVKIHFDGWRDAYDYVTTIDHEDLHHVGFCRETGVTLQAPGGNERWARENPGKTFVWSEYLKSLGALPVTAATLAGEVEEGSDEELDSNVLEHSEEWHKSGFYVRASTNSERGHWKQVAEAGGIYEENTERTPHKRATPTQVISRLSSAPRQAEVLVK